MAACASCGAELPAEARFCPSCGSAADQPAAAEMLKLVTVLFADVVGSTARAEGRHPEDVRAVMADFFEAMSEEIRFEDGTIEKFVGDAIMAVFGVPTAHEDDPVRAVRASRRMLTRLERWNDEHVPEDRIEIRVGVNTGEVLAAGAAGDLMVTGDAVNVAARLEQAAEAGQILLGHRTARAVRDVFELMPVGALDVKGKEASVEAWAAGPERRTKHERGIPGLAAPLVGRDRELELLQVTFRQVTEERRPRLVTILGDAGVGKSRLVRELVGSREVDTKVMVGRCLPYGEGVTLWPLGEMLKAEALVLENEPADAVREKVSALVREAIPPELVPDPDRTASALASTVGLPPAEAEPREAYRALLAAWRALLAGIASSAPVLAVVEDIHWAGEAMLDIVEDLAERVEGPVLFVCTARAEVLRSRPDWGGGRRNFSALPLDPLGERESSELVAALLDVGQLPGDLRARILERSEGNPFFLEEIVRQLIDEELVVEEDGRWRARAEIADIEIPDTVQAVILARIDLLPPEERHVLQQAAVVGRTFWRGAVEELTGAADLDDVLRALARRELVVERLTSSVGGEDEYMFKHVLTRDVAYETLPRRERARAHAAASVWIERLAGERIAEFAEFLAHHHDVAFSLGGDDESRSAARRWYLAAADAAARRFAPAQAKRYEARAVELAQPGRERGETLEAIGDLANVRHSSDDAWQALLAAIDELGENDPSFARLAAKAALEPTRWGGGMHQRPGLEEVSDLIDRGLDAAGAGDSWERAALLTARALLHNFVETPDLGTAEGPAREAVDIATRLGDADLMSGALDALGGVAILRGTFGEAYENSMKRLELVPRLTDPKEIGDAFSMAAWGAAHTGRYRESIRHASAAIERSAGSDPGSYLHGHAWYVWASVMTGAWEEALRAQAEIDRLLDGTGSPPGFLIKAYAAASFCHELRGEGESADRYLDLIRRHRERDARPAQDRDSSFGPAARAFAHRGRYDEARALFSTGGVSPGPVLEALCEIAAAEGAWDEARELVGRARAEAARCGLLALPFFADRLEGRLAAAAGEAGDAVEVLRRSAEGFAELGTPWEEAFSRLLLAELGGGGEEARRALVAFERLGAVAEVDRARSALGSRSRG